MDQETETLKNVANNINIPFSMVLLAKRNTGKTVLAEYILNKLLDEEKVDVVYVFSKTCQLGENWKTIPKKYKYDQIEYDMIYKLRDYQAKEIMKKKDQKEKEKERETKKKKDIKNIVFVFDDVIDDNSRKGEVSDLFNELFSRGRHFKISVMICNQYVKNILTPTVRSNVDYLFLSCNTNEVLNEVYKIVIFDGNKKEFIDFINQYSQNHYFVLYDNLDKGNTNRYYTVIANMNYLERKIGKNKY